MRAIIHQTSFPRLFENEPHQRRGMVLRTVVMVGMAFTFVCLAAPIASAKSAASRLSQIARCFSGTRAGDPADHCEQAFKRWIYQRVYCPDSGYGGDYVLAPEGTVHRYIRRSSDGRPDAEVIEAVVKLRVEEGPAVRMWIRRWGERSTSLISYLVDGRTGAAFFDTMDLGNRVVSCRSLEPYLPPGAEAGRTWSGSGCWLTDSVSGAVYPHAYRSLFADLFLPGSMVTWRHGIARGEEPVKVRAGEFSNIVVRRSTPFGRLAGVAEFEEVFARGAGRIRSSGHLGGRQVWEEDLTSVAYPTRPRDPARFCADVE